MLSRAKSVVSLVKLTERLPFTSKPNVRFPKDQVETNFDVSWRSMTPEERYKMIYEAQTWCQQDWRKLDLNQWRSCMFPFLEIK